MALARQITSPMAAWSRAYTIAMSNALLFAILSGAGFALNLTSIQFNCAIAAIFLAGSLFSAALLIRAGEGLVAIAFFVLGAGITFGFGTIYGVVAPPDYDHLLLFSTDQQERILSTINFVNAISVLTVLVFAWPFANVSRGTNVPQDTVKGVLEALASYELILILASILVIGLELATYPVAENLLLRGFVTILSRVPLVVLLMVFAGWKQRGWPVRFAAVLIAFVLLLLGILSTSKTAALIPIVAVVAGLWLNRATRPVAIGLAAATMVGYFLLLAPLSQNVRSSARYDNGSAGLSASLENLTAAAETQKPNEGQGWIDLADRFSAAPYQSYLISRYEDGEPGHSLGDFWVALVPRILWADKPNVTRFGGELYGEVNRTTDTRSQLAPTYSAEAFWNYGWFGVVGVSAVIGLQMGWFSRRWLNLVSGRRSGPGILVLSIPVALTAFGVEQWIAASYVGGFVTLVVLIVGIDAVSGFLSTYRSRPQGHRSAPLVRPRSNGT